MATCFGKQLKVKWKNAIQRRGKIVKQQTINIVPRYQDGWNAEFIVLPILHQLCNITCPAYCIQNAYNSHIIF